MEPERVPIPDGVWMFPRGIRWSVLKLLCRILGAKCYPASQNKNPVNDNRFVIPVVRHKESL